MWLLKHHIVLLPERERAEKAKLSETMATGQRNHFHLSLVERGACQSRPFIINKQRLPEQQRCGTKTLSPQHHPI